MIDFLCQIRSNVCTLAFFKLYVNIYLAKTIAGRYSEYKGVRRGSEVVYDNLGGAVTKKRLGIPVLEASVVTKQEAKML